MTTVMRLDNLLEHYRPGSHNYWSWSSEFLFIEAQLHAEFREGEFLDHVEEFGILNPIVLGDDKRVWDGHHRLYAAWKLGYEEVPVVRGAEIDGYGKMVPFDSQQETR